MNQVCLNGRLAQDPEGGESAQGVQYATFQLAVTKLSGGQQEVMFISCCAFRTTAEFVRKHFHKGDGINLTGSLNVRDWTDQSGVKHRKFEILADKVGFPQGGKTQARSGNNGNRAPRNSRPEPAGVAAEPSPEPCD